MVKPCKNGKNSLEYYPRTRGGGEGDSGTGTERLCPKVQPLTLLYTILGILGTFFCIPSIEKRYPFHIPT